MAKLSTSSREVIVAIVALICGTVIAIFALDKNSFNQEVLMAIALLLGFEQLVRRWLSQLTRDEENGDSAVRATLIKFYQWTEGV